MAARECALERFWPYWGWYLKHVDDERLDDPRRVARDAFVAGFLAGGAQALRCSADLARLVPTVEMFTELLATDLDVRARE